MFSTRQVLDFLRRANPGARVSEDRLRHALRSGAVGSPCSLAGRLLWTPIDVRALATALRLNLPPRFAEAASSASGCP